MRKALTYDEHNLRADALAASSAGVLQAARIQVLVAVLWGVATLCPVEGGIVLLTSLPAFAWSRFQFVRACWHTQQMRLHIDRLKPRRY